MINKILFKEGKDVEEVILPLLGDYSKFYQFNHTDGHTYLINTENSTAYIFSTGNRPFEHYLLSVHDTRSEHNKNTLDRLNIDLSEMKLLHSVEDKFFIM